MSAQPQPVVATPFLLDRFCVDRSEPPNHAAARCLSIRSAEVGGGVSRNRMSNQLPSVRPSRSAGFEIARRAFLVLTRLKVLKRELNSD